MPRRNEDRRVTWGIRNFPEHVKDEFLGQCKSHGKDWKVVLGRLMKKYTNDLKKVKR